MGNYRDRLQIIADILFIASKRAKKTHIMYQANLSYRLLCRYLGEVTDAGLVSFESGDCYVLTAKGKEFLNRHEEYSKRCKSLEEHLNHVNNDKIVLEKMCSNTIRVKNNLNLAGRNRELRK
jgi:predicted transcriptional regulator